MARARSNPKNRSASRRAAARDDATVNYDERRREILRAAAQVFKDRGLRGGTLSHVAELLGTERAALYYYYSSKEEIFQELVTEAVKDNLATAEKIRRESAPAPEKVRALMEGLMVSYADFYPVLYVLIQENLNHIKPSQREWASEMKRINRRYEQVLIAIVQQGQDEGTLRAMAPAWVIAYGIIGMLGWTYRWFTPGKTAAGAEEIGPAFADVLLDGLVL